MPTAMPSVPPNKDWARRPASRRVLCACHRNSGATVPCLFNIAEHFSGKFAHFRFGIVVDKTITDKRMTRTLNFQRIHARNACLFYLRYRIKQIPIARKCGKQGENLRSSRGKYCGSDRSCAPVKVFVAIKIVLIHKLFLHPRVRLTIASGHTHLYTEYNR